MHDVYPFQRENFADERYVGMASELKPRPSSFVIDGEAVILGDDGLAGFDRLHARHNNAEVRLIAFDLLAVGGAAAVL